MKRTALRRSASLVLCLAALTPPAAPAQDADPVKGLARERGIAEGFKPDPQAKRLWEKVVDESDSMLRDSPNDREALGNRAAANLGLGRTREAIRDSTKALRIDPKDERAYTTRALAHYHEGGYAKALRDARRALWLNKGNGTAQSIVKMAEAELAKDRSRTLEARSEALVREGRYQEALLESDRSIGIDPWNAAAYKSRAAAREGLADLAGMISDLRRAASLNRSLYDEYLEAAAKYNFHPSDLEPRPQAPAREEAPAPRGAERAWRVILYALMGGALIALGLIQKLELPRRRRRAEALIPAGPRLDSGYRVLGSIAHGGMGVILEAEDVALGRKVAIKKMRDEIRLNDHERERFLREARIVASLRHPNIVDIHTIIEEGEDLYLVFELVEGRSVEQLLAKKGRLRLADARAILHGAAKALDYAHRHGVVHRDLKPSNIMITDEGVVKVMDFGIAHLSKVQTPSTATNTVVGTPLYMAPEQERGAVRRESDVYALGACLYEMVTGQRPFPVESASELKRAKNYVRPSLLVPGLPPAFDSLVDAALEPDPDLRLRSAAEFRALLDALRDPSSIKV